MINTVVGPCLLLVLLMIGSLAFDAAPEAPGEARDDDRVARFMTASTDSVLTVLNGNLWMLPSTFAVEKEARISRFVRYARRLRPHVIILQEIWMKNQVAYLKRFFPDYQLFASGSGGPVNEAGLVTLTRLPGEAAAFSAFDLGAGANLVERHAGKGYLAVWIETPAFKVCLINTHLYAPGSPREQRHTAQQFETLKRLRTNGHYVVVGDLNLGQLAFDRLNDAFFLTEADTTHTVEPGNRYRSLGINATRQQKSLKSDRMLMSPSMARRFSLQSMLIRQPVVSDHYLLAYRIQLHAGSRWHMAEGRKGESGIHQ